MQGGRVGLTRRQVLRAMGAGAGLITLGGLIGCTSLFRADPWISALDYSAGEARDALSSRWVEVRKGGEVLRARLHNPQGELGIDLSLISEGDELDFKSRFGGNQGIIRIESAQGGMIKSTWRTKQGKKFRELLRPDVAIEPLRITDLKDSDKILKKYAEILDAFVSIDCRCLWGVWRLMGRLSTRPDLNESIS